MCKDFNDLCATLTGFPPERVVVLDTETTGASPHGSDEIVSVAICDVIGGPLLSSYVRPARNTSWPYAERVHGISPAMVKGAPTIGELAPQISELLLESRLIVGYNAHFDLQFLFYGGTLQQLPTATFDVMRKYARVHGSERRRYSGRYAYSTLSACAASYGYAFGAHDALEDARATAHCFRALLCDEAYARPLMEKRLERLRGLRLLQTKATTAAVLGLVGKGVASDIGAELRFGSVMTGRTKGAPRYECFVGERCVGVMSPTSTVQVGRTCALGGGSSLPARIPCRASLSAEGERARCKIAVTAGDNVVDRVLAAASRERLRADLGYRR